jgi:hypothetical protein
MAAAGDGAAERVGEQVQPAPTAPKRFYFWMRNGITYFDPAFCLWCGTIVAHCARCGIRYGQPLKLRVWFITAMIVLAFVIGVLLPDPISVFGW